MWRSSEQLVITLCLNSNNDGYLVGWKLSRCLKLPVRCASVFFSVDEAVLLYCSPDCLSCPANVIQMGPATWAIWAAEKKYMRLFKLEFLYRVVEQPYHFLHGKSVQEWWRSLACSLVCVGGAFRRCCRYPICRQRLSLSCRDKLYCEAHY